MIGYYFLVGTIAFALIGYAGGRWVVPRILYPLSPWTIARFVFGVLTIFVLVRTGVQVASRPWLIDWNAIIETYADITVIALGIALGYDSRALRLKSIKGGLAIAPDGGLHIVDCFTEPTTISIGHERA